jgi:hypothetical protein
MGNDDGRCRRGDGRERRDPCHPAHPAKDVVRVRLTVTSRAAFVKVTTEDATITNTSVDETPNFL